jgi:hypothetical protein
LISCARPPHGVDDLHPAAVGEREAEHHAGVLRAEVDRLLEHLPHALGQLVETADRREADVVVHDLLALLDQVQLQEDA